MNGQFWSNPGLWRSPAMQGRHIHVTGGLGQ